MPRSAALKRGARRIRRDSVSCYPYAAQRRAPRLGLPRIGGM